MLHRRDNEGLIVITQPAHSWVSGQLAKVWGNERFGEIRPFEEVGMAAALHDVGFLDWEQAPTLNAKTGWPHSFMDLPTGRHLELWTRGIEQMLQLNRYAALLTSLHYSGLAERHPVSKPLEEAQLQQKFLSEQRAFQSALLVSLRRDPYYAPFSTEELVQRNRRLIAIWDWMSLVFGMGMEELVPIEEVPAKEGFVTLKLLPLQKNSMRRQLSPWPFRVPSVHLVFECRRLAHRFQDEQELRGHLQSAPVETLSLELTPG